MSNENLNLQRVTHSEDGCIMKEEVKELGDRVKVIEEDVSQIKDDQHKIMKSQDKFSEEFTIHYKTEEQRTNMLSNAIDKIGSTLEKVVEIQQEQSREMIKLSFESKLDNREQDLKMLQEKMENEQKSFWGKLRTKVEDKLIDIIIYVTLGGGALLALYRVGLAVADSFHVVPK